jgi:hypothetical protein
MEKAYAVVGCLQQGLMKYGLSVIDAFILSKVYDIIDKDIAHKRYDSEGNVYYYWNFKQFVKAYPVMGIQHRQMSRKAKKYCDIGVLSKINQYLPCSGKYPYYTAPHYRFTKEAFGSLFGHKNRGG